MELENQTPFAARLLRLERPEGQIQATLVVKATFEEDAGRWIPAAEQVPIVDDRLETPFGIFHTDCFVRKEGVDVCVLGTVRPAQATPVAQVRVSVAGRASELKVFGDRRWTRSGGRLVPSAPVPFTEMALGYARAYGGVTEHDYESCIWPDNPSGRGYYLSPERAEGQPLPNIEAVATPVREWSDQPMVAGWGPYPYFWGIRAREGIEPPKTIQPGDVGRLKARLNNHAHPSLIFPGLRDEAEIRIQGLGPREWVRCIPWFSPLAEVRLGERMIEAQGSLDGVFVWADLNRVTLTKRIHFGYEYKKGEKRMARLKEPARST